MPYKMKGSKTMRWLKPEDFVPVVTWEQIDTLMLKHDANKFKRWMRGQTTVAGGVYPWDLERFLKGLPAND